MENGLKIELLLEEVVRRKASDLHLQVGLKPMLRIDGALVAIDQTPVLDDKMVEALVMSILDEEQQQILLKDKEFDFSFAFGNLARFRANAFHERGNLAMALRSIPNVGRSVSDRGRRCVYFKVIGVVVRVQTAALLALGRL